MQHLKVDTSDDAPFLIEAKIAAIAGEPKRDCLKISLDFALTNHSGPESRAASKSLNVAICNRRLESFEARRLPLELWLTPVDLICNWRTSVIRRIAYFQP